MSSIVVSGDTSGAVTLSAPAVAGTVTVTLPAASGTMASLASVTANGVAYVNSSGQPTSGSALVFDGTNLGVGVTPSAWGGSYKTFQLPGGSIGAFSTQAITTFQNAYDSGAGSYVYSTTAAASRYTQSQGLHQWFTAASGTAGNAITFTQAMTIDANGNQLLGVTSNTNANNRLYVVGPLASYTSSATTLATSATSASVRLSFAQDSSQSIFMGMATDGTNYPSYLQAANGDGTTASNLTLQPFGGNLLVGTTSGTEKFCVTSSANASTAFFLNNNGTAANQYGIVVKLNGDPNNTNHMVQCLGGTTERATIRANGGLANYSANNVNLSDARTKTDIRDAGGYLAKICAIPVRTFKYKDQTDDLLNLGCIAQEVEAVAPELVDISGFGETPDDGVPLKAIYQTDLQYALMKCIQEQQAIITTLTARITALESA